MSFYRQANQRFGFQILTADESKIEIEKNMARIVRRILILNLVVSILEGKKSTNWLICCFNKAYKNKCKHIIVMQVIKNQRDLITFT